MKTLRRVSHFEEQSPQPSVLTLEQEGKSPAGGLGRDGEREMQFAFLQGLLPALGKVM